jgi:hypothetical protein
VDQAARKVEQDEYFVRFYYPSWLNKFNVLKKEARPNKRVPFPLIYV